MPYRTHLLQALVLAIWLVGLPLSNVARAQAPVAAADPLQAPACLAARRQLDAAEAEGARAQSRMPALRQQVAAACLRATADPVRPARLARPPEVVRPTTGTAPLGVPPAVLAMPAPAPMPTLQPPQVSRCDAGGCFDAGGARLNRSGPHLVNPQGQLCTQQGTVLVCP